MVQGCFDDDAESAFAKIQLIEDGQAEQKMMLNLLKKGIKKTKKPEESAKNGNGLKAAAMASGSDGVLEIEDDEDELIEMV